MARRSEDVDLSRLMARASKALRARDFLARAESVRGGQQPSLFSPWGPAVDRRIAKGSR